jgi:adenylyltransferase/sulfurtransferase
VTTTLTDDRLARFSRQLLLPGFGEDAQARLLEARVRVVGAAGAAAPALVSLVQAGIGRVWIDDPEAVGPADLGWLYGPGAVGSPRAAAARAALAPLTSFGTVDPYPVGGVPTAALLCAPSVSQALAAAEQARRAAIPHVVLELDGDGGTLVSVPPGAPCYACGRSTLSAGRPPLPGAAALAALAAAELVLAIALPGSVPGRRIELVRGALTTRPTARLAGCACGQGPASAPPGAE